MATNVTTYVLTAKTHDDHSVITRYESETEAVLAAWSLMRAASVTTVEIEKTTVTVVEGRRCTSIFPLTKSVVRLVR